MTPWGGRGLTRFGKSVPDDRTGESLEVSVLPGLESRDEQGRTLTQLLDMYGEAMRGTRVGSVFPLLLKLISADESLSVQVHPDDRYAAAHERGKLGKTEAWVILRADPGAQIVYGLAPGVTKEELRRACAKGGDAIRACLNFVDVAPGQVYYIPAGVVHALGGGVTLMEIQQSSDVTYRFYDWDRVDAQGRGRELHIEKGLDVIKPGLHLDQTEGRLRSYQGGERVRYLSEGAFSLERWRVNTRMPLGDSPERFRLLCAFHPCRLEWDGGYLDMVPGESAFLPAQMASCEIAGSAEVILCWPGRI